MVRLYSANYEVMKDFEIAHVTLDKGGVLLSFENGEAMYLTAEEALLIAHRALGTKRIKMVIVSGIKQTINIHGPITKQLGISGASDRIFRGLLGLTKQLGKDWASIKFEEESSSES